MAVSEITVGHFPEPEDQALHRTKDTHAPRFLSWDSAVPQGIQCRESISTAFVSEGTVSSQSSQHESEHLQAPASEQASTQDMPRAEEENMPGQETYGRPYVKNGFLHFYESIGEDSPSRRSHSAPPSLGRALHSQAAMVTFRSLPCQGAFTTDVPADPAVNTSNGHEGEQDASATVADAHDASTTLMVGGLPSDLSRNEFVSAFLQNGYAGLLDFVYMPMNFRGKGNFGYAFLNFSSHDVAVQALTHSPLQLQGWSSTWSNCQGFNANVERYRNSPLMHELVPEEVKPATYDGSGAWIPFPAPSKKIPKPRVNKLGTAIGEEKANEEGSQLHPGRSKRRQPQMKGVKK